MSFWDHLFDNEYKQRTDIEALEEQVGELALLCRSLLTILREDGTIQLE